jgi:hypothetical protein
MIDAYPTVTKKKNAKKAWSMEKAIAKKTSGVSRPHGPTIARPKATPTAPTMFDDTTHPLHFVL